VWNYLFAIQNVYGGPSGVEIVAWLQAEIAGQ
jgi:hypothetical protein